MGLASSDIELVSDFEPPSFGVQQVGLRFTAMTIPAGAVITDAYLTFRAVAADSPMTNAGPTNLTIRGQLIANAPTFTTTSGNISSRTATTASTLWVPASWTTGTDYNSPSVASVIQEIVNQGAWASGNAIAIIITGSGHRASQAYDSAPATAARLVVTYDMCPGWNVTTTADTGIPGTLRECIKKANGSPGQTITVPAGTYTLAIAGTGENAAATGDLDIAANMTISGAGAGSTIIQAGTNATNGIDRVFEIQSGVVATVNNVTVRHGFFSGGSDGGGFLVLGALTLEDSVVTDNQAQDRIGGGVYVSGNSASLIARRTIFANGVANDGGAIGVRDGTLVVEDATLSGNQATRRGGALHNDAGAATVVRSTFTSNSAGSEDGGAILNRGGGATLTLTNSTLSGNLADRNGGGFSNESTATLLNVTITANTANGAGGGIRRQGGTVNVKNTIVANNTAGGNCSNTVTSQGFNLESSNSCGFAGAGDQINTNPLLGPLTGNGGLTATHALLAGSPAIDTATAIGAPATDQRGVSRPQGAGYDIGAYELGAVATFVVSGAVFEDLNYGGGAGRNRVTALGNGGSARPAARVELFDAGTGAFITSVLTNSPNGDYSFTGVAAGIYTVRVVSSSVTSSRTAAALRSVMTFRTNASSGTAADVTDYVGGHDPATQDSANAASGWILNAATGVFSGSGSGKAHAFASVTVGAANVTGVDFGWNFDTVSNTNSTGQGSLFGAITNANTLGGDASLAQSGRPAGIENVLFMISNGTAAAGLRAANNYFVSGVASISPTSTLPTISAPLVLNAQAQPGWTSTPIIELNGSSAGAGVTGLTIAGGGSTVRGLVINRFLSNGINVTTNGGNTIAGSYVGTNSSGTAASPNAGLGIYINNVASNTIGGTAASDRNVVSGHTARGINISGASATGNSIQGNYVGTNAAGSAAIANGYGIVIDGGATGNTVGGSSTAQRNVISGNSAAGIRLGNAFNTFVRGNYIGTAANGTSAIPNTAFAVVLDNDSDGNLIGGTGATDGNLIALNGYTGVTIAGGIGASTGNGILANSIYGNASLGIDLDNDGVSANDGAKNVGFSNEQLDHPVFTSSTLLGGTLSVVGYVGIAPGQALFAGVRVEIFESDNDASGYGEGPAFLGFLTADVNGRFTGDLVVTGLAVGEEISGTATDGSNNTSEFGPQIVVTGPIADMSIAKFDSPDPAADAGDLLYTLLITNIGPSTATNVTVTDILPGSVTFQSATPSQGSCSGTTTVTCNLGAILASGTASVEILVVTGGPGTVNNSASVAAAESDPVPANNTASASTQVSNQVNNDVPLTQYRRIHGFVDSTVTGGTLRTQPNSGNACLVGASSTAALSGIPGTATIVNAYLYWAGSGTTVDSQVTLDGAALTADRTWQADYTLGSNTYDYFGGFEDVTAQVAAKRNGNYTFSGLTVATGNPWCASTAVMAGWSLFVIYEDNSLTGKTLLLYDGFDLTRNGASNYLLTGIYAAGPPEAKAIFLTWEGDETLAGTSETLRFNGTALSDGLNPVNNVYNSTINNLGVTTSYGVDLDSFNVSSLIAERDTLATAEVSTGPDLVVLNALLLQVKSNIIAGRVFEDVNYGGGAGRSYAAAVAAAPGFAVGRPGARLELYDVDGNFLRATTTDVNGYYGFAGLVDGNYFVRAVNSGFSSSRPGATGNEWPVQTYRTDAGNGSTIPVTNEVGGAGPAAQDSAANLGGANLSTLTAQSVAPARVITGIAVSDVDFGYSFDAIVNKNNAGQGSVRQFLTNVNTLSNAGLAQAGRPAAIDNAVFMLADGTARPGLKASYPNLFVGGVATIAPTSTLPTITDPVVIDGQTQPGWSSTPIIELNGASAGAGVTGLSISAGASAVRGLVVNGFLGSGIALSGSGGNTIQGNYLGTNAAGTASSQNDQQGVYINGSPNNLIGGTTAAQRNVISGNRLRGILISGAGATGNTISGNFVGTNAAGTGAVANIIGIYFDGAGSNTVGGTTAGAGNVISGNTQIGLYFVAAGSTGNVAQGNFIGLNAAASAPIPNGTQGVEFTTTASNNTIGGVAVGAPNIIASNGGDGVRVSSGTGNLIQANSIYGNGGIGINLGLDGVTANDGVKTAGQPNLLMDVPVFTSVALAGPTLTVTGYVGNAPGQSVFAGARVEIFKADGDPSGSGEGQVYLGFLTADANGNFSGSLAVSGVALGDLITGTATDGSNNTSEFAVFVSLGAPTITVTKSSAVLSDPFNNVTNPKRIPGAVIEYSVTLTNTGNGSPDAGTVVVTDPIDRPALAFRVSTGVTFIDGATSSGVGLGLVTYSSTPAPGPYLYNYTPVPDVNGYDGNITSFMATTTGSLAFGGAPPPGFTLRFQVKVK